MPESKKIIINELKGTLEEKTKTLKEKINRLEKTLTKTYELEFKVPEDFDLCMLVLNDLGFNLLDADGNGLNYIKNNIKVQLLWKGCIWGESSETKT